MKILIVLLSFLALPAFAGNPPAGAHMTKARQKRIANAIEIQRQVLVLPRDRKTEADLIEKQFEKH